VSRDRKKKRTENNKTWASLLFVAEQRKATTHNTWAFWQSKNIGNGYKFITFFLSVFSFPLFIHIHTYKCEESMILHTFVGLYVTS
jgi:hypothetical protein